LQRYKDKCPTPAKGRAAADGEKAFGWQVSRSYGDYATVFTAAKWGRHAQLGAMLDAMKAQPAHPYTKFCWSLPRHIAALAEEDNPFDPNMRNHLGNTLLMECCTNQRSQQGALNLGKRSNEATANADKGENNAISPPFHLHFTSIPPPFQAKTNWRRSKFAARERPLWIARITRAKPLSTFVTSSNTTWLPRI